MPSLARGNNVDTVVYQKRCSVTNKPLVASDRIPATGVPNSSNADPPSAFTIHPHGSTRDTTGNGGSAKFVGDSSVTSKLNGSVGQT
ncbi:hypothetical protein CEXT_176021 [Caerostris extrusa]|uniref:Uncharacterized protein n=1 Tax=Caerostris extrusa TaxID=172846 RepID=A0AAV4NLM1_CAEEX|nr:hypothetical protein CEXT_176021 [Caerostris extrusa]